MTMPSLQILAWGLLPTVAVALWEASRRRAERRRGFLAPVSPEGIRWTQYAGWAYVLGYAALAMASFDSRHRAVVATISLVVVVVCTALTSGLLLWYLGYRYGSETPRLADQRAHCYRARTALVRRSRLLARAAWHGQGACDPAYQAACQELVAACDQQLRRLQAALRTEAFLRRVAHPAAARVELGALDREQRRLLEGAAELLGLTVAVAHGDPVPVWS
ncbi:MAG: hypothetical protein IT204_03260 [Fimbriimonadaceae bacterium]|nr:hypothetical protein [Fimbriimonadaceae bacterium]